MSGKNGLLFLGLGALATSLFLLTLNHETSAQGLKISDEDYENGAKRFAAVKKMVTPRLKTLFEEKELKWGSPIFIRAFKKERQLELWVKDGESFVLFDSYFIAGTSGGPGPKLRQGDGQIPEGFYFVTPRQMNPQSNFHLSFNIGYPNKFDRAHGRTGDFIMVHGSDVSIGCMAMTNTKIEEIYTLADAAFKGGQKFFRVHVFPFKMTDEAMTQNSGHRWFSFWKNLKTGYQMFQDTKLPPNVTVKDKTYQFEEQD
ncbi:murein L,D-transpeptidase [Akkermansiaceae bacterium]|nr:murein L,D-transpeptidase [Akkermansiaceae bacterium]